MNMISVMLGFAMLNFILGWGVMIFAEYSDPSSIFTTGHIWLVGALVAIISKQSK